MKNFKELKSIHKKILSNNSTLFIIDENRYLVNIPKYKHIKYITVGMKNE